MLKVIKNINEFCSDFNESASHVGQGYVVVMLTDKFDIQRVECAEFKCEKLFRNALEIRMFNKEREIKWFRTSIDKELQRRERIDVEEGDSFEWNGAKHYYAYWDEYQYLDIDDTKNCDWHQKIVYATGGGRYPLPIDNYKDAQVQVRNYLSYEEETNQVYITDWRLVDFVNEGE